MSLLSRFVSVFRSARLNREIECEHEFHIASRIDELMADGMPRDEAERQTRLQFGSRARFREESHDARLFTWLESAAQDLYYGFRSLLKSPSFAVISILTLALGIGANTAVFSVVNGVLLNPLPYPHPDRIVSLFDSVPNFEKGSISYPNFLDWRYMNRTFSTLAAYRSASFNLSGQGEPEHLEGEMISAGFFEIFGVSPLIGRTFTPEEDRLNADPTAMISEKLWKRKFGSRPDILGQRLVVDGVGRTIIGVVPASFQVRIHNFQQNEALNDIYVPIGAWDEPQFYAERGAPWGMDAIGRLKPGVTLAQARDDMTRVSRQLARAYPDTDSNQTANLIPLKEEMVGDVRSVLLLLLGAVAFVLLISCVNIANLLLARSAARRREIAVRLAVGAGQLRVVRQLLTESVLLALLGGAFGLLLARFGTSGALAAVPRTVPRAEGIGIDFRVVLFTFLISLAAGILFGLAPAWKMRRANLGAALKESGRSVAGPRSRTQQVFVVLEMAMALVLLVGAGLMIRTLLVLWGSDPGFNPHEVLNFYVSPPASVAAQSPPAIRAYFRRVHDQLATTPGVESVSLSWASSPVDNDSEWWFWIVGRPKPAHASDLPLALVYVVEPGYLETLRIPLIRGRFLASSDDEHAPAVAVIDESFARKYFPHQNPIGQYIDADNDPTRKEKIRNPRIVGIVGHVNQWGLDADSLKPLHAQMYFPALQMPDFSMRNWAHTFSVFVRAERGTPDFQMLRRTLSQVDRGLTAYHPEPMSQVLFNSIAAKRFAMVLLSAFAALALLLAGIGIYGVLSYLVGQRTQEIGVRMALGAARFDVLLMILADGTRMTLIGIGIGVAAALGLTRLISGMLFGVKPYDLATFALVAVTLCAIALLACYLPARRAMRVDPLIALREE